MIKIYNVSGWMGNKTPFQLEVDGDLVVKVYSLRLRWITGNSWAKERSFLEAKGCTITEVRQGDKHVLHTKSLGSEGNTGRG